MTCPNCTEAAKRPEWPGYTDKCLGCTARGIANGPDFWKANRDGTMNPAYLAALRSTWGPDWRPGHEAVKAAAEKLRQARETVL